MFLLQEYNLVLGQNEIKIPNCGAPCYKLFFNHEEILKARTIIGLLAILSASMTAFALLTYLVNKLNIFHSLVLHFKCTGEGVPFAKKCSIKQKSEYFSPSLFLTSLQDGTPLSLISLTILSVS